MTGHTSSNAAGSIGGSRLLPGSTGITSKIARRRCRPEPRPEVELGNWAEPDDDASRNSESGLGDSLSTNGRSVVTSRL
jgi:hypothetical protein